jgi:hypothetical protein
MAYDLRAFQHCPACGRPDAGLPVLVRTPHVSYVERRMARGDYARNVGRELWGALNRALNVAHDEVDDDLAAFYSRCLVYLTLTYDAMTSVDQYQGRQRR